MAAALGVEVGLVQMRAPQIVPGRKDVWVLTPSALARADPATATITVIIHTAFAPSARSAPALIRDSAGRLWITGSLLSVVGPGALTAYRSRAHRT